MMSQHCKNETATVRRASVADADRLYWLINAAYRNSKSWTTELSLDETTSERMSKAEIIATLQKGIDTILVAEVETEDGKLVVGCVAAESCKTHVDKQLPPASALIGLFAVDPLRQSQGIGKLLLDSILEFVKTEWKCSLAVLWVIKQRTDVQKWYERLGFTWHGEIKHYKYPTKPMYDNVGFKVYTKDI